MGIFEERLNSDNLADVFVAPLPSGKRRVCVEKRQQGLHVPFDRCETAYPLALIQQILDAKGSAYLIDEILRDESPGYVQHDLKWSVLSNVSDQQFAGKRILDFGCGSGGSSVTMARMFPDSEIVGIELEERLLNVAKARARFYGFTNLGLHVSPAPNALPAINYLPGKLAHYISCRFSPRNLANDSWESLLRAGIRGGTINEVVTNLPASPVVLEPRYLGMHDRIDLWLALTSQSIGRASSPTALLAKRLYRLAMKPVKALTGIEFLPDLALEKPA